jgi:hypothetical protein
VKGNYILYTVIMGHNINGQLLLILLILHTTIRHINVKYGLLKTEYRERVFPIIY